VLARLEGAELDEPALALARETCQSGSPISRAILWRQFWQARRQSLAEVFADELALSVNCVLKGDFVEGCGPCSSTRTNHPAGRPAGGRGLAG
jgi:enoyl-CoA hydratase/carnithine racemase